MLAKSFDAHIYLYMLIRAVWRDLILMNAIVTWLKRVSALCQSGLGLKLLLKRSVTSHSLM